MRRETSVRKFDQYHFSAGRRRFCLWLMLLLAFPAIVLASCVQYLHTGEGNSPIPDRPVEVHGISSRGLYSTTPAVNGGQSTTARLPGENFQLWLPYVQEDASLRAREQLTAQAWQSVTGNQEEGLAPDITTWHFCEDGTFRWSFVTDYTEHAAGAWAVSPISDARGVLFLARNVDEQAQVARFDALSFTFSNGRLRLGEMTFEGIAPTGCQLSADVGVETKEAVASEHRSRFFTLWTMITSASWQSESDPPPGEPAAYSFAQDGSYTAYFAATQCQYTGTWSLYEVEEEPAELWFTVPANACDPRGPREAFVRQMFAARQNGLLVLNETAYGSE